MCGIIGFIGFNPSNKFIINGLLQLQNRGYDSAGICTLSINNEFLIFANNKQQDKKTKKKTKR